MSNPRRARGGQRRWPDFEEHPDHPDTPEEQPSIFQSNSNSNSNSNNNDNREGKGKLTPSFGRARGMQDEASGIFADVSAAMDGSKKLFQHIIANDFEISFF